MSLTPLPTPINEAGFAVVPAVLPADTVAELIGALQPLLATPATAGIRGLAGRVPAVAALAQSAAVRALVEPVLGNQARLVRALLFNKNRAANWQVGWHQDLSIAVQAQLEQAGYSGWSVKAGVVHVQPPVAVLEQMLTVRLHLDAADEHNGALWVVPGSHRSGRLAAGDAAAVARQRERFLCAVQAGDAVLFRPLLIHASGKAHSDRQRRVIHLEFAAQALPEPLVWAEADGDG